VLNVKNNEGAPQSLSLVKLCLYIVLTTLLPETLNMSSVLLNIVPILNSTNWQFWSESIDAYVMSKGHCHVLTTTCPTVPAVTFNNNGNVDNQSDVNKATEKQKD
jgi:hypothetical protein